MYSVSLTFLITKGSVKDVVLGCCFSYISESEGLIALAWIKFCAISKGLIVKVQNFIIAGLASNRMIILSEDKCLRWLRTSIATSMFHRRGGWQNGICSQQSINLLVPMNGSLDQWCKAELSESCTQMYWWPEFSKSVPGFGQCSYFSLPTGQCISI